jgi:hypothetical protein
MIPAFWRELDAPPRDVSGPTMILLDHSNVITPGGPEILDETEQSNMRVTHSRLLASDPFMLYKERRIDAQYALWSLGQYGECCVQAAIAAEVLFDSVLGMLLWEECRAGKTSAEEATEIFSTDLIPRLRGHFHNRIGGTWSFKAGHLRAWDAHVATIRNRVVHAGYQPDGDEANAALDTIFQLERFVVRRLVDRFSKYPLTSILFVGQPGFERVGRWKAVDAWLKKNPVDWLEMVHEYTEWREQVNVGISRRRRELA